MLLKEGGLVMATDRNKKTHKGRGRGEPKASPKRIKAAQGAREALEMRLGGSTYAQIGEAQGISAPAAAKRVDKALEELAEDARPAAEKVLALELARLDRYLQSVDAKVAGGDVQAVGVALKVQERRSKLCGLDAPSRHQVEVAVETEEQALETLAKEIRENAEFRAWCLEKCKEADG